MFTIRSPVEILRFCSLRTNSLKYPTHSYFFHKLKHEVLALGIFVHPNKKFGILPLGYPQCIFQRQQILHDIGFILRILSHIYFFDSNNGVLISLWIGSVPFPYFKNTFAFTPSTADKLNQIVVVLNSPPFAVLKFGSNKSKGSLSG